METELTIPGFIQLLANLENSSKEYIYLLDGRHMLFCPAMFEEGAVSGWDLVDAALVQQEDGWDSKPGPNYLGPYRFTWREDRPEVLEMFTQKKSGVLSSEPVSSIRYGHLNQNIFINGEDHLFWVAQTCETIPTGN